MPLTERESSDAECRSPFHSSCPPIPQPVTPVVTFATTGSGGERSSMSSPGKLSVVLPVRDDAARIALRVQHVWDALRGLTAQPIEIIVVDDASSDTTLEVLEELCDHCPPLRVARHDRPRGMEAAGQTGLERATGELVFVQETNTDLRVPDLRRLLEMSDDASVVAARAESTSRQVSAALLRRLRAWGTDIDRQLQVSCKHTEAPKSSLQMIRRPHWQRLAGPGGNRYQLQSEMFRSTTIESAMIQPA